MDPHQYRYVPNSYQPPKRKGFSTHATVAILVGAAGLVGLTFLAMAIDGPKQREVEPVCDGQAEPRTWGSWVALQRENEAAAIDAWRGECLRVSGIVRQVEPDHRDRPVVTLGTSDKGIELHTLRCRPAKGEHERRALALFVGQSLTVEGVGGDKRGGALELDECKWAGSEQP